MKTFYLRKLRRCIKASIRIEANTDTQTFQIVVDHPQLSGKHILDTRTRNLNQVLNKQNIKAAVHAIMQKECDEYRKALRQIGNLGWWLALIMATITLIWLF